MSSNPVTAAIQWSGPVLVAGAIALGAAVILISSRPEFAATLSPDVAALLLVSTALLLLSLPAMYAVHADAAGTPGLGGHIMLATGLLLPVLLAASPLLHPSVNGPTGEHPIVFGLGIALTLGFLPTGIATFQADVLPRQAALLLVGAMPGFFVVFFVAESLPPAAGQIGTAIFGVLLGLRFAWIGAAIWLRSPAT